MVDHIWGTSTDESTQAFGNYRPEQVATVVGWLAGERAGDVTGQVFTVFGNTVQLMRGWQPQSTVEQPGGFTQTNLDQAFDALFSGRARDRKSVEMGKSVSVRVDLGGRRIIKQKK